MQVKCLNRKKHLEKCPCTSPNCARKGICCKCLAHHLKLEELPACCFSKSAEKTYDRSFKKFIEEKK